VSITSTTSLAIATILLLALVTISLLRRVKLPYVSQLLILLGAIALSFSACGFAVNVRSAKNIIVLLDLSPSTRTATYRDPTTLKNRLTQLLPRANYQIKSFGENADRTIFDPPHADAIVLFSDAQFDLPKIAPPTYIVIDPNLENPPDAAVTRLESRGRTVTAALRNLGPPRQFELQHPTTIPTGSQLVTTELEEKQTVASAHFTSTDPWPENDRLDIILAPEKFQQWWAGASAPPGWTHIEPTYLPQHAADYLLPSIVVLDNVPANKPAAVQQDRLQQFVHDLGGSLLILGGDHAFAAGDYSQTILDSLSPLASFPPQPQRNWILLVDSSGSMASRWPNALAAMSQIASHLPPNDSVRAGNFARDLHWWPKKSPPDISPTGPTNLQAVLESLTSQLDASAKTEIILISDADTSIADGSALAAKLSAKNARLNLLATADISHSPVPQIVRLTGGKITTQTDANLWSNAVNELLHSTMPNNLETSPVKINFANDLQPSRMLNIWNRTWLKSGATVLASANDIPMIARWRIGAGQVIAAAFPANSSEAQALAALIATPPRDPRFHVSFTAASRFRVSLDAVASTTDLNLTLDLLDDSANHKIVNIPQTAPGRYEILLPAPRSTQIAIIRVDNQIIDRFAVAGRYAPEFDAIGNNHESMQSLASQTGGNVIYPMQISPINFPPRKTSLVSLLAILGSLLLATGLITWKYFPLNAA
jgi:hypothetical protein